MDKDYGKILYESFSNLYAAMEELPDGALKDFYRSHLNAMRFKNPVSDLVDGYKESIGLEVEKGEKDYDGLSAYGIALKELGVKEVAGARSNPRILEYQKSIEGYPASDDNVPWCSYFVAWCHKEAGIDIKGVKPNARSWLKWGESFYDLDEPAPIPEGTVVVLWRGSRDGWQGHVGFLHKRSDKHVWLVGGNQSNQVSIAKYPIDRVLDYRCEKGSIST